MSTQDWLHVKGTEENISATAEMKALLDDLGLHTVCEEANCPNVGECFFRGTATFLVLGNICTRNCRFCAVAKGKPLPIDDGEPARVAEASYRLGLKHVVVTSVTRDDLSDGGAAHFAQVIYALRERLPKATVEVLVPDFQGSREALEVVLKSKPDVLGHNVETIPRLYSLVRPKADYMRSLNLLKCAKEIDPDVMTKSGLMVGLGEEEKEVHDVLLDLREVACDFVTIGQYLRPSPAHVPIASYVTPEMFQRYKVEATKLGFRYVASSPFVRSSFHAEEALAITAPGSKAAQHMGLE